jgi:hypothetical protein
LTPRFCRWYHRCSDEPLATAVVFCLRHFL